MQKNTEKIRAEAHRLGFEFVGFARAEPLEKEARNLEKWLSANAHGAMKYMENHFDLRIDPRKLVPGARSVICLTFNYFTEKTQPDDAPKLAKYAFGEDYHHVLKQKLRELLDFMRLEFGEIDGRCFVDSAPVMEREWAARAGLGWNGKNTLTIHPKRGSYFFLAEIICDLELPPDDPLRDHCGTCTRCIDACPTEAISPAGYFLDASKCISYLTIELKDEIPSEFSGKMADWMFGCDICQEVCPWNRFSKPHSELLFEPSDEFLKMEKKDWEEISEEVFGRIFKKSAVKRTKFSGLKRNLDFLKNNS
jgi:epoxyqueuosine reductase